MMQRIDLAPLLRETVATPYSDMVTRSTGAALRDRIEQTISGASHRTTQLDFTSVGLLDFSCADEAGQAAASGRHGGGTLRPALGRYRAALDAIDHVLERHGLSVAALTEGDGAPRLLGVTTPTGSPPFRAIQRLGAGDASACRGPGVDSRTRGRRAAVRWPFAG
jgi:hypothetical protein